MRCALLVSGFFFAFAVPSCAQPEVMGWGNLEGIRINGHLHAFDAGICVVEPGWTIWSRTGKERQQATFFRRGSAVEIGLSEFRPPRRLRPSLKKKTSRRRNARTNSIQFRRKTRSG